MFWGMKFGIFIENPPGKGVVSPSLLPTIGHTALKTNRFVVNNVGRTILFSECFAAHLGFRVSGLGFRIYSSGQGVGLRAKGLGSRV